ncbi:septal ring lytic transglycosylase RlpA family protein [Hoeflea sp. BAL378]|uniref:septal ring lytic transglycosylase RlpA family protein n=1 Tax=Hoeflea sp. BAL378 TaxID=1547437 RepID=UPI00069003F0|nr:septal ring lytic transglycosylase RlpA family protein [Hoeflea sp. BAL378]
MTSTRARARAGALILSSILAASVASPAFAANPSCGRASWYALTSKTASGERMDPAKLTAAHPRLSFGTRVKVTNPRNGKTVVVRINDRGPFVKGRIIDVSKAAAGQLGMINSGVAKVCFHVVS